MRDAITGHPVFGIIAEFKRSSPSAGALVPHSTAPPGILLGYEKAGAAAVSILTDGPYFGGSLEDLLQAREITSVPVLRKEFIVDEYQIHEAKAHGADAVLLIAGILEGRQLNELHQAASSTGMESLVELYNLAELDILDTDRMCLVGVNNRDLHTFSVDPERTVEIARHLPSHITVVSESGIRDGAMLRSLRSAGIRGALIGEHFLRSPDPGAALAQMLSEVIS
jgi:indole-3-glycerol phosphate synthase